MVTAVGDGAVAGSTVVVVAFGQRSLDLGWVPVDTSVIVVHNDDLLAEDRCRHTGAVHLHPGRNVGFGQGVNLALARVQTRRVVVCNPDMNLDRAHFLALASGQPDEIVTVPLVGPDGRPIRSVVPYPSVTGLLMGTFRVVPRLAPLGSRRRSLLARVLGSWGDERRWSVATMSGRYPLREHSAYGTVFSIDTERLRQVGGFDSGYFLYLEDIDLCQRLAERFSDMVTVVAQTGPAFHEVGGSAHTADAAHLARRAQWDSAVRYASGKAGVEWRAAELAFRLGRLAHRAHPGRTHMPNATVGAPARALDPSAVPRAGGHDVVNDGTDGRAS